MSSVDFHKTIFSAKYFLPKMCIVYSLLNILIKLSIVVYKDMLQRRFICGESEKPMNMNAGLLLIDYSKVQHFISFACLQFVLVSANIFRVVPVLMCF